MNEIRLVTESEALADARKRHQREVDAWPVRKARRDRFVRWCQEHRPTLTQAYCDGSEMIIEQFLLWDAGTYGTSVPLL